MQEKPPAIAVVLTTGAMMMASITVARAESGADRYRPLPEPAKSDDFSLPETGAKLNMTAQIIGAQLHRQGVACTGPRSAHKDAYNSVANEIVWILHCDEGAYSVRLIPHIGARITPIH